MSQPIGSDEQMRGFLVRGRVQGVGFRWWTQRLGERLELRGHVRNLGSGDVEVHAAGTGRALGLFEEALREGPPTARVTAVDVIEVKSVPARGFHIEMR